MESSVVYKVDQGLKENHRCEKKASKRKHSQFQVLWNIFVQMTSGAAWSRISADAGER